LAINPRIEKKLSRADLVAAAVERNRDIWVRMAVRITSDLHDAEDAVQEAIARVLTGPRDLPDAESTGRYLTRSVNHCAIDRVRSRSKLVSLPKAGDELGPRLAAVAADQEARLLSAEAAAIHKERLARMLDELKAIPRAQREAIELLILRDPPLNLREASELTGAPISTLHSRLNLALEKLRDLLSEN
jgi:RNA polymerase sigma factor (sigma-70 family)